MWELVRKDLRQFAADRKAMIISFAVPVSIASFMGLLFGNITSGSTPQKIGVLVVDQDRSAISKEAVQKLNGSPSAEVKETTLEDARAKIRKGEAGIAVVIPPGFGDKALQALAGGPKPQMEALVDPARSMEAQVVQGAVIQATMGAVAHAASGSDTAGSLPFEIKSNKSVTGLSDNWSGVSHAFAGMAIQGLLFWAVESAMIILRERRMGIWSRLRSAPISGNTMIFGRLLSSALRALLVLSVVIGFGIAVFGIRVRGSYTGLALLGVADAFMAAGFGLFVASLGKTEAQSRGLTILAVLTMTMLGGAWFPSFMMPGWVQTLSLGIPVRWAVDGLDGMTWRGLGLDAAAKDAAVLLGFATVFTVFALRRFRYESS
jgi:ABC-2 type transport system permease protein